MTTVRGYFITGTDTGVGKTLVACALALRLRQEGQAVLAYKPVETGCVKRNGCLYGRDVSRLLRASSVELAPWGASMLLAEPLAPAVAAERAGRRNLVREVESKCLRLGRLRSWLLVEGAGGLLVPLAWHYTVADLARALGLPVIVVARAGLGTINHSLLTLEALRKRRIAVAALVLNGYRIPGTPAERTNPEVLQKMDKVPVIRLPWVSRGGFLEKARSLSRFVSPLVRGADGWSTYGKRCAK